MTAQHGGSYILDPVTGERTLVTRTVDAGPAASAPAGVSPGEGTAPDGLAEGAAASDDAAGAADTGPRKRRAAAGKD